MAAPRALAVLGAAFLLAAGVQASKYSREANEGLSAGDAKRREAGEFRVVRLNQVWEKAQRVSEAAREERARWRRSEGVLWQSCEGGRRVGHSFPVSRLRRRGAGGEAARAAVGAGEGLGCEEKPGLPGPASPRQAPGLVLGLRAAGALVWFLGLAAPERQLRAGQTQPRSLGAVPGRWEQRCCVRSSVRSLSPFLLLPYVPASWEVLIFPCLNPAVKRHAQEVEEGAKSVWYRGGSETGSCTPSLNALALFLRGVMLSSCPV